MEDKRNILREEKPFSYKKTKDNKAIIYWYNKQIMIVNGKKYDKLILAEKTADDYELQMCLAKITGHFKHGNE